MQQTETLKLNLIEGTDTVDPAPINENMETLEAETTAIREEVETVREEAATEATAIRKEMTAADTALAASLESLAADVGSGEKNCRIAWGSYNGDWTCGASNPNTLTFDFTPVFLICYNGDNGGEEFLMFRPSTKAAGYDNHDLTVSWTDNSVSWYAASNTDQYNMNQTYVYVALGMGE